MEVSMFRKATVIAASLILGAAALSSSPASAATKISNGVACTKQGATTKVGGYTYKCAKNTLKKNSKLTWLSAECITAISDYAKAQKTASSVATQLTDQVPALDAGITAESAKKAEVQPKLDDALKRLNGAKAMLAAATTAADKTTLNSAVNSWTAAVRAYTSAIARSDARISTFQKAKALAVSQGSTLTANVQDAQDNATLICTNGL